jgi:hypothetical protein
MVEVTLVPGLVTDLIMGVIGAIVLIAGLRLINRPRI